MSASTSRYGLPYSIANDAVSTVDDTMQALAQRLDLMLGETGTLSLASGTADTAVSQRVNYSRDYSSVGAPTVMVMQDGNVTAANTVNYWVTSPDATGFTLNMRTSNTTSKAFRWTARTIK